MANDYLRIFLYTVDRYKELTGYNPGDNKRHDLFDDCSDEDFGLIQIKLMLLRKYVSDNTEDIHLRNILKRIDNDYPGREEETRKLLERLESLNQSEMRTFLSNGKALNLRKVFALEAYGLLLHADAEKFEELIAIDEQIVRFNIRKYVEDCEELVLDTATLVGTLNVPELVIPEKTRAEVISISNPDNIQQEIKKSPHWANLLGRDAKDGEAFQEFANLDEESQTAIITAATFIELLRQKPLDINSLKEMVALSSLLRALRSKRSSTTRTEN